MKSATDSVKKFSRALAASSDSSAGGFTHALQQLIDDLPEEIALLDEGCTMIAANRRWREVCEQSGHVDALPGCNYRDVCAARAAEGYAPATQALAAFDKISTGALDFWEMTYNGGVRWAARDYQFCVHRIEADGHAIIMVTRTDLTELLELRRLKSNYSLSLIEGQTVERRRVARELHDSTSQLLVSMGLVLARLKQHADDGETLSMAGELQELLGEAHQEIRLISYLAHPPAIEKMGLTHALSALVDGFGRRTGKKATFEIVGDPSQFSSAEETALYRIAQEALSNVHRHARAKSMRIMLCFRRFATHLIIADDGVGVSRKTLTGRGQAGVGLASMRCRLLELGGRFSIRRLSPGTAIVATLPTSSDLSARDSAIGHPGP